MTARALFLTALVLTLGCAHHSPTEPTEPMEPCEATTLVVVTIYGDTTRFDDYEGPPPANLQGVRERWWECAAPGPRRQP